jgi:hypothetical protein
MKDNAKKHKTSSTISIVSICICLVGIIISAMHLRYTIVNEYETGTAYTMLVCMIAILFSNISIFLISSKKHKSG